MFHPGIARSIRHLGLVLSLAAAPASVLLLPRAASADALADGEKFIQSSYEISNINEYSKYLFVVFPYTACMGWGDKFFEMNPDHDVAGPSYHVMVAGEPLEQYKHCHLGALYAFENTGFTIEKKKLESNLDFYRGPGRELVRIKEFEDLKASEKIKFLASDKRVKKAVFKLSFPLTISSDLPVTKTLDVLRVAELSETAFRVEGEKLVATLNNGSTKSMNYEGGKRPDLIHLVTGSSPQVNSAPSPQASAQSTDPKTASGQASKSSDNAMGSYIAGASAAVLAGLVILAAMAKGDKKKRKPKA